MKTKSKIFWFSMLIFAVLSVVLVRSIKAASSVSVTATVTAQNISLSVSDGVISYGALSVGESTTTTLSGVAHDSQVVTNNGNITEKINIKGQNSNAWTLSSTPGAEQYVHSFCTSNCDASPTWTPLTVDYATLSSSLTASSTADFDLRVQMPTSTIDFTTQNIDVIVQAALP